jgi:hypothetical protein
VWTSLIGHASLDGYEYLGKEEYLRVARSACEYILRDIEALTYGEAVCIIYVPGLDCRVHNANTLGANLLARTFSYTGDRAYLELGRKALLYTAEHQRQDGPWYYAEKEDGHWIDSFHTGFVLDCYKCCLQSTNDRQFEAVMNTGYEYWKKTFYLPDGTPRYYNHNNAPDRHSMLFTSHRYADLFQ